MKSGIFYHIQLDTNWKRVVQSFSTQEIDTILICLAGQRKSLPQDAANAWNIEGFGGAENGRFTKAATEPYGNQYHQTSRILASQT